MSFRILVVTVSDERRANSSQSVRIRNLESEVTRLLSENVSLREQVIKQHHEAEKATGRAVLQGVDIVKLKLEAKLAELGGLVQELGNVQKNIDSRRVQRRSMNRSSPRRSPDQKNWKNALTLSEVTGGTDGRLPPIVEDKYYPRRTMEYVSLHILFLNADSCVVQMNFLTSLRTLPTRRTHQILGRHLSRISRRGIRSNLTPLTSR